MRRSLLQAFAVMAMLTVAVPTTQAASDKTQMERKLEEGARALLESMRFLLKSIPWYGPPEVQPNGDILIPRRDGPPLPGDKDDDDSSDEDPNTKRL